MEKERALAHIEKITDIRDHPNGDRLSICKILGWSVITVRDEFENGDLIIFVEPDSILPDRPEFEFMRDKKFRVRTIKLRGLVSQGICFPLSILPSGSFIDEGEDVTSVLNIEKYVAPIPACLSGQVKGRRPNGIPKTDEERIQNVPNVLERHRGKIFYISEKIDGCSGSDAIKNDEFIVCSRKLHLKKDDKNTYWEIAEKYDIEKKLRKLNKNICIQGECWGLGIQGNKYKKEGHELCLFDIFDIDKHEYCGYKDFIELAKKLDIPTVPIINDNFKLDHTVEQLLELADGQSKLNPLTLREGIVLRPLTYEHDEELGRLSFKVVSRKFLLKYGD